MSDTDDVEIELPRGVALAWGIAFVVLGFVVRSEQGHLQHPATPPPATA